MNELYHYGVLGMKWGHKKATAVSSKQSKTKSKEKVDDPQAEAARKARIKKGIAITAGVLGVIGLTTVAVIGAKKMAQAGMNAQKALDKAHRSNIAKRGAETRRRNREASKLIADKVLSTIGKMRTSDWTAINMSTKYKYNPSVPVKIRNLSKLM